MAAKKQKKSQGNRSRPAQRTRAGERANRSAPEAPPPSLDRPEFIIELCTRLWRVEKRLAELSNGAKDEQVQMLGRRFEDVKELLSEMCLETREHSDQPYDSGLSLQVVAFVPDARADALGREVIIETISPTILRQGRVISQGKVVVAQPSRAEDASDGAGAAPVAPRAVPAGALDLSRLTMLTGGGRRGAPAASQAAADAANAGTASEGD